LACLAVVLDDGRLVRFKIFEDLDHVARVREDLCL